MLQQYSCLVILFFVVIIRSKPTICTARMAYASLDPHLYHMLRFPRDSPRGCGARWCGAVEPCWGGSRHDWSGGWDKWESWMDISKLCSVSTYVASVVGMARFYSLPKVTVIWNNGGGLIDPGCLVADGRWVVGLAPPTFTSPWITSSVN